MEARIKFTRAVLDSQTYNAFNESDDHMVSRLFFDLEVRGERFSDMLVEVRQPYGSRYETEEFEVSRPTGPYKGPWNHGRFAELCAEYFRSVLGEQGKLMRVKASNFRMKNCTLVHKAEATMEVAEGDGGGW